MHTRSQQPVCKLDQSIADVDDGVPALGAHISPLRIWARGQDLQTSEGAEQYGDAAEICVRAKGCAPVVERLRGVFYEPHVVVGIFVQPMETGQGSGFEMKMKIEMAEQIHCQSMYGSREVFEKKLIARDDLWMRKWLRCGKNIVLRHVEKFASVGATFDIHLSYTDGFVSV